MRTRSLFVLNQALFWLKRLITGGLILTLSACSPLAFWRQSELLHVPAETTSADCLQAPGPQPQEDASAAPTDSSIAAAAALGPSSDRSIPDRSEPPPLLPMPTQRTALSPQLLPQELLVEAEPAPAPRCAHASAESSEPALVMALRFYLAGQTESAVEQLRVYEEHDQEFLLRLFPLLAQLHQAGLHAAQLTPQQRQVVLESLRELSTDLRSQAPLVVRQAAFCRRVQGFGKFQPVPGQFTPGEAVGLYCEVDNLQEQVLPSGQYTLTLEGRLELRNGSGKTVWHQTVQFEPDLALSPRRDHFLFLRWHLPAHLQAGNYTLVLTLKDVPTQRTCTVELPLRITVTAHR